MSQKKELLKQLNNAIRNYRISVRWYRDTITYKNVVTEAWDSGRMDDLKADADRAYKEAVAGIFRWRKRIDRIRKELMDLASKGKAKHD